MSPVCINFEERFMTYRELLDEGVQNLKDHDISEAALDARLLLEYVTGLSRAQLIMRWEDEAPDCIEVYMELIERRGEHVPLQQIVGYTEFMGLRFRVNEHVLCPRQDTEVLVEEALREPFDGMRILDLCTGSGCILLSLLHYSNYSSGLGVDLSPEALKVAEENAGLLGLEDRASFLKSDLYEEIPDWLAGQQFEKFDLLVSNPPYIKEKDYVNLMPEVRDHEPKMALTAGEDGLAFYRRILDRMHLFLHPGARVLFEIGYDQADEVRRMMTDRGLTEVTVIRDYGGNDRVACGRYKA